jgi:hypothetical protein
MNLKNTFFHSCFVVDYIILFNQQLFKNYNVRDAHFKIIRFDRGLCDNNEENLQILKQVNM